MVENKNAYNVNPDVALGSSKWLTINHYNGAEFNTPAAYAALRKSGYTIVATTPHTESCMLDDLPVDKPIALIFGTEKEGLSEWAIKNADAWVKIPMYGFTESFNISVSAALCMYNLTERIRKSQVKWELTIEEQIDIRLEWIRNTIDRCHLLEERFFKETAAKPMSGNS
ncbi:MAG: rRNA methyltransferase [Bacteroidetes bacterium HGW-Bacteroidetes-22]|nr:MAG: rRNA methyltransferase [Bacteroidetes bacterium HGW-Bacteroidetes-22]